MDVLDAGVFVSKWEAPVPRDLRVVLWGPLQAKELGLEGWDVQDGGETGLILHHTHQTAGGGRGTCTLIVARRVERAFVTTMLAGYPSDLPQERRDLDTKRMVSACEVFLSRIAGKPVRLERQGELALVDNQTPAVQVVEPKAEAATVIPARRLGRQLWDP